MKLIRTTFLLLFCATLGLGVANAADREEKVVYHLSLIHI